ncbi:MAG: acyltransferase [Desulfobacteraceae bacterium]|nr:acyltransferase [Desulfobacteraceae bacterium]MCF8096082.1 acyltransferase [Desulfobacteraceae bacterium]
MLYFFPPFIRGIVSFAFYVFFTVVLAIFLLAAAVVRFLIPVHAVKLGSSRVTDWIASEMWVRCALCVQRMTAARVKWETRGIEDISIDRWSLIVSNHQSWVDILVLVRVLAGRVPPYKFFIKKGLLWLPFMGQCFWALDFPVMNRYSRQFLEKYPHLKGRDLETARKSCEKFRNAPVTIMNFVEGTRFTPEKHRMQGSPFSHLLKPRAGGLAMAIYAMGSLLEDMIDITVAYPEGVPGLWDFFCGRVSRVKVDVRILNIPEEFKQENYFSDPRLRWRFNYWLNRLWEQKDRRLEAMLSDKDRSSV